MGYFGVLMPLTHQKPQTLSAFCLLTPKAQKAKHNSRNTKAKLKRENQQTKTLKPDQPLSLFSSCCFLFFSFFDFVIIFWFSSSFVFDVRGERQQNKSSKSCGILAFGNNNSRVNGKIQQSKFSNEGMATIGCCAQCPFHFVMCFGLRNLVASCSQNRQTRRCFTLCG